MTRYIISRFLISIPTLLAISFVIFGILALAPGDPLGEFATNPSMTAEVREQIRRSMGLDQPVHVRYYKWLTSFAQGDMGYSFATRSPVSALLMQRLPTTLWVVGIAYLLAVVIAVPLGVLSAVKRYSLLDQLVTTIAFFGFSLPTFFTGILFIIIFSVNLNWFPYIYNSTLKVTDWNSFLAQVRQSIMPITVLALFQMAQLTRFMRSAMIENLFQDYVRTARAKGIREFTVVNRHVLRNALIPVVTLIAIGIPTVFGGAIVTEQVFRVPGLGALLISAIQSSDTPVVMAITFLVAILIVFFSLIADILYGVLDPRVRYS